MTAKFQRPAGKISRPRGTRTTAGSRYRTLPVSNATKYRGARKKWRKSGRTTRASRRRSSEMQALSGAAEYGQRQTLCYISILWAENDTEHASMHYGDFGAYLGSYSPPAGARCAHAATLLERAP